MAESYAKYRCQDSFCLLIKREKMLRDLLLWYILLSYFTAVLPQFSSSSFYKVLNHNFYVMMFSLSDTSLSSLLIRITVIQLSLFFQCFPYVSICFFSCVFLIRSMLWASSSLQIIEKVQGFLFLSRKNSADISVKIFVLFNNLKCSNHLYNIV